jgi:hypothetical protein
VDKMKVEKVDSKRALVSEAVTSCTRQKFEQPRREASITGCKAWKAVPLRPGQIVEVGQRSQRSHRVRHFGLCWTRWRVS